MIVVHAGWKVMTLGDYVRQQRGRLGLTQRQLAEMVERDATWLSRLETNRARELPGPEEITALARALRCDEAELLRAAGYLQAHVPEVAHNGDALVLANTEDDRRWSELPPALKRRVMRIADAFLADDEEL